MNTRYDSKVDLWLGGVLIAVGIVPLVIAVQGVLAGAQGWDLFWMVFGVPLVLGLLFGMVWPCHYTFEQDELVITAGLFKQRIRYADISKVEPSRNLLSSPALSLDRLQITHGGKGLGWTLISPRDKKGFLDEIHKRAGLRSKPPA